MPAFASYKPGNGSTAAWWSGDSFSSAAAISEAATATNLLATSLSLPDHLDGASFLSRLDPTANFVLGSYLTAVGIASLLINSLSIYSAVGRRRLKLKPVEHFMLSLNVADMGMVVFTFPFAISSFYARRWLFSETGCIVIGFLSFLWGIQNLMTVVILAATRYVAVCYPHRESCLNTRTTIIVLTASVTYSFVWSAMPLGVWGSYDVEPYGTGCTIAWTNQENLPYVISCFFFVFFIPFIIIVGCYVGIYRMTARSSQLVSSSSVDRRAAPSKPADGAASRKRNPAAKLGALLSASYFVCWFPYAVVSFWAAVADTSLLPPIATALPAMLAKTSVLFNPVLYLLTNRRFRRRLKLLGSSRRSSSNKETSDSSLRSPGASQQNRQEHSGGSQQIRHEPSAGSAAAPPPPLRRATSIRDTRRH